MKHVQKAESPREFEEWKALANADWQPTYATLQNPQKCALHAALLAEQGWVCCYCGRSINPDLSDSHIEHFRPQESHDHLALSYENLHASCLRETPRRAPVHCGHFKDCNFDEEQHISPLDPQCEGRFIYTLDGQIAAGDRSDAKANYMIGLLALDIAFLRNRRQEVVLQVFDADFLMTVTREELLTLRDAFRMRNEHGHLRTFSHVLARFAEQRLAEHA